MTTLELSRPSSFVSPLVRRLAGNRFLPAPPRSLMYCGAGDFRAIGAEFLGHFITLGKLAPHERVLDIGCGVGRMAVPLTQYLDEPGSYDGIDIAAAGIAWCRGAISASYPAFRFHHLDLAHPLYNPDGTLAPGGVTLPFADASFDFVCMVSLLTHLEPDEIAHYAREAARLLAPGGRCFATTFLMNDAARAALAQGVGALPFDPAAPGPVWYADMSAPSAAVAFEEAAFMAMFAHAGLRSRQGPQYGAWSGRTAPAFQDLCVFSKEA